MLPLKLIYDLTEISGKSKNVHSERKKVLKKFLEFSDYLTVFDLAYSCSTLAFDGIKGNSDD